uniref:Uncharacterized protein LOC113795149 n=1 Tax=Dermatophagoides pteronyssinus TaxID=6956 RepID=A0A6P6Y6U7_DERPT|nr:uncharacterized protein LOC113795149 [Dermatophagoides pteronyssinus]
MATKLSNNIENASSIGSSSRDHHHNHNHHPHNQQQQQPTQIADVDLRHHKLLQNFVTILKINNVLEEYRLIVRQIQQQCCCKRTRQTWERLNILETKYKELNSDSNVVSLNQQQQQQQQSQRATSSLPLNSIRRTSNTQQINRYHK